MRRRDKVKGRRDDGSFLEIGSPCEFLLRFERFATACFHQVEKRAQFHLVLAFDAVAPIDFIQPDLDLANERQAAQIANVMTLLDPLRERETFIRRQLGSLGFELFDGHGGSVAFSAFPASL